MCVWGGGGGGGGGGGEGVSLVGFRAVEIGYGFVRHGCSTDDVMKSKSK